MGFTSHLIGVAAIAVVVVALWFMRRVVRRLGGIMRRLAALRRGRSYDGLDNLPPGTHLGLHGRVVAIDRIKSPLTGREAVYIDRTEEVWDNTPNVMGAAGKWVAAAHNEEAAPFELTDGQRSILVDPSGAEVLAPVTRGSDPQAGLRFAEEAIEPEAEIVVLGHLTEQGGFTPEGGYRGSPFRRVIADGARGLLIATPGKLYGHIASRLGFWGGLLLGGLVLASFAFLVATNMLPVVKLQLPGEVVMEGTVPETYLNYGWSRGSDHAQVAGPVRVEVWVLGWIVGGRPERILERRLGHELWVRQLNGIGAKRRTRRRAYGIFDVLTLEGVARRRPGFWRSYCKLHPGDCPGKR